LIKGECDADNWIIELSRNDSYCYLYHRSYIKTLDNERFFMNNSKEFHLLRKNKILFAEAVMIISEYDYNSYHK